MVTHRTKQQLLDELTALRRRVAELEGSKLWPERAEETLAPAGIYDIESQSMADAVAARTQAEQRIIESEQLLHGILAASPIGIGKVKNRAIVWVNETLCSQSGYTKEELQGKEASIFYENEQEHERIGGLLYEGGRARRMKPMQKRQRFSGLIPRSPCLACPGCRSRIRRGAMILPPPCERPASSEKMLVAQQVIDNS
jgi:PAS domain-containing protein